MSRIHHTIAVATGLLCCAATAQAQWVTFANETGPRMPVGPGLNTDSLSTTDTQEKDYAFGDVDQDGDIDLVCVRKQPFTSGGRRVNVLFMNEGIAEGHSINGVLVDRTALYASASLAPAWDDPQIPGGSQPDQGFLTATNDRDVVLVDVNNDTWLDIVTAPTLSDNAPNHIGHPRVYINLGEDKGAWLGFQYEPARIPFTGGGNQNIQPRFCSVGAVDVTGDGYVDLYFGDYDSGGAEQFDYNNKFLINQGAANPGYFEDTGTTRISANPGLLSAFGAATAWGDMNGDGAMDWVKQTSLNSPLHIAIHHNNPNNVGFFPDSGYKIVDQNAPYFVSAGDLNNDGRLDLVVTDDNADGYYLNSGNAANGNANFGAKKTFSFQSGSDDGFGSQSVIADLNNDGWNDVLIADVDVDITGCGRRMHIYRNLGNAPNVTLQEASPSIIPTSMLQGTHNVAVFDINNDGWLDLVIGRCSGTQVWMNVPPAGLVFTYPQGLPGYIQPDSPQTFQVQVNAINNGTHVQGSGKIFVSQEGGPFVESPMTSLGGNLYEATLPATKCPNAINFYFSGQLQGGGTYVDPPGAPGNSYLAVAAIGTEITFQDEMEADVSGWTVVNAPTNTSGAWEAVVPNGTINSGAFAAPNEDATGGPGVKAFVTKNGPVNDPPGNNDVDGGPTWLTSPTIDLAGTDANISFAAWFYSSVPNTEFLGIFVSNDNGNNWTLVEYLNPTISGGNTDWVNYSFVVGDYVTPTSQVRVRFEAEDRASPSIVEAGIDDFFVNEVICDGGPSCPADVAPAGNGDGTVNVDDLLLVINQWGQANSPADITGDGNVNVDDLLAVINNWGACP